LLNGSKFDCVLKVNIDWKRNRMILQDQVALVTGETSGIGRATAISFGAAGAEVVFCDRPDVEGEETAALIRETGAECFFSIAQ
jgi:NAD(P)-dependent dehydrogenase (short-subunit alcohol dehydrogenase family)